MARWEAKGSNSKDFIIVLEITHGGGVREGAGGGRERHELMSPEVNLAVFRPVGEKAEEGVWEGFCLSHQREV